MNGVELGHVQRFYEHPESSRDTMISLRAALDTLINIPTLGKIAWKCSRKNVRCRLSMSIITVTSFYGIAVTHDTCHPIYIQKGFPFQAYYKN